MGIADWLRPVPRPESTFSFEVTDIEEVADARSSTDLANLLGEAYIGNDYLASLAERYGHEAVRQRFLAPRAAARPVIKRGDLGEAVTAEYLKHVEGYSIPIPKLRYKITANQTLPGTDCLALKLSNGTLQEVVFVESKFRASVDMAVATTAAKQLKQDADNASPDILTFVARQLRETKNPLADIFEAYFFSRIVGLEKYIIMIVHEKANWTEGILSNLEDEDLQLEPLHTYVAKVTDLKELTDAAFSQLGVEVSEDDD